jgi:cytochrome bd-type quinol oxidase subunit 2
MKRSSTVFLQIVIVLIAIGALALMLWEPHIEGRNAHATPFEIYFKDPFLAYAYIASIPFFVALYQAFKVLGYAGQNKVFSQAAVKAMRTIKFCAIAIIGFVAVGEIFIVLGNSDDRAGGVFMGILITFGSIVIAAAAAMFERILQSAVDIKSENDLTV